MKTFVAVARREIAEKRFVLWAALVMATQPFAVPLVRGLSGNRARDVRDMTAMLLGVGLAAAVAAGLGSSTFAGELAAKRIGFFFSRPISASSLWAGKLAGGIALVLSSVLLVLGPAALFDRDQIVPREALIGLAVIAGGLLTLLLVMNFLSTMVRSRSWVALADIAAVLAIGVALGLAWTRLRRWHFEPPASLIWIVGAATAAALLWSSYRAVARGRTDLRSAHAAMSASLWAVLGGITAALVGYEAWVLSPPPTAFHSFRSAVAADGWVFLQGNPRGVMAGVLYDTQSARFDRLPADDVAVSSDGRIAAWVERNGDGSYRCTLFTRRLDDPAARPVETKVSFASSPFPLLLSADGARVAAAERGLLTVSEIATGRTLASTRIGETSGWRSGWFAGPDRVRIVRMAYPPGPRPSIESIDLDLASRGPAVVHSIPAVGGALVAVSRAGDRIVLREGEEAQRRLTIRDAATLEVVAPLRDGPPAIRGARFLEDGSIVMAVTDAGSAWVDAFSPSGVRTAHVRLGDGSLMQLGEQPENGRIFVAFHAGNQPPSSSEPSRLFIVDLRTGTAVEVAKGLHPLFAGWWSPKTQLGRPGSESSRLFEEDQGALVRFDPATGGRKVLLGGR